MLHTRIALIVLLLGTAPCAASAQIPAAQLDSSRNNLIYASGYQTRPAGELGGVEVISGGARPLVFIGGWGFGGAEFREYARSLKQEFTTYLITLPGFDGTPGWALPPADISHAQTPWILAAADLTARLIRERQLHQPVVIGHFIVGAQVALELARAHADLVGHTVIVGGELNRFFPSRADSTGRTPVTPEERERALELFWLPRFFKFVTPATFEANNYLPQSYSIQENLGRELWQRSAQVPLPIMIEYLSEYYAADYTRRFLELQTPILLLQPEFTPGILADARLSYLRSFFQDSWQPLVQKRNVVVQRVPESGIFVWRDQPELFRQAFIEFVGFKGRMR